MNLKLDAKKIIRDRFLIGVGAFFCLIVLLTFPKKSMGLCLAPGSPSEELQKASAVFMGKVIRIEETDFEPKITFQVLRFWKGKAHHQISVFNYDGEHSNDIKFGVGQKYVVYAYEDDYEKYMGGKKEYKNILTTNRCTHTTLLSDSGPILKVLGAGKKIK